MVKKNKNYRLVSYFDKDTITDPIAVNNMVEELSSWKKPLHFKLKKHADGWMAQCKEIKGIITGNTNPNPSEKEIVSRIREAILAAFSINTYILY